MSQGQLDQLNELYTKYTKDPRFNSLRGEGINFVQGSGPVNPTLMLVGESPGRMENAYRQPFRGKAGQVLTNLLLDSGIDPGFTFMTNVIKYWPKDPNPNPANPLEVKSRPLHHVEIEASREYLRREIEIVNPLIVGLCGRSSLQAIYPTKTEIYAEHGILLDDKYVPLYHPAVVLYAPQKKPLLREGYHKLAHHIATFMTKKAS